MLSTLPQAVETRNFLFRHESLSFALDFPFLSMLISENVNINERNILFTREV